MQMSVYLLPDTVEILRQFGTLSEVTDRILYACEAGEIDIYGKPSFVRSECRRFDIDVTSTYYIELLTKYPAGSAKISLSRLLNWFATEEIYAILGWSTDSIIKTSTIFNKIAAICKEIEIINRKCKDPALTEIQKQLTTWGIDYETRNK